MRPEDFAMCFEDDEGPILNEASRRHLYYAAELISDEVRQDLDHLRRARTRDKKVDVWAELTWCQDYFPSPYAASYDVGFVNDFQLCLLTVIYKLGCGWSPLASVAEQLAMNALMHRAITYRELREDSGEDVSDVDVEALWDVAFADLDFELLFDASWDGIQDTEVGREMGMVNLDRSQWFDMLPTALAPPHPLQWPDTANGSDDAS